MQTPSAPGSDTLEDDEDDIFDEMLERYMVMAGGDPDAATQIAAQVLHIFMVESQNPKVIVRGTEGDPDMVSVLGDVVENDDEIPAGTVIH